MPRHAIRTTRSSRRRFADYLAKRRAASARERIHDRLDAETEKKRARKAKRPFSKLLAAFWRILAGHRLTVVASLVTLSVSVAFQLVGTYAFKVAIDYILSDNPGPSGFPGPVRDALGGLADHRVALLWILGGLMAADAMLGAGFAIWGRWQCTRITKRVQVALRRRVFDHASRLTLARIQAIKAGGVASILREDAGGVGELIFSLIYNPWRAITQLIGTFAILVTIDWRLLAGAVAVLPLVWFSHKTWIGRIRPMFRDIRQTRQAIDAQSAEAFGGMRVVRGFNRRQAEAARFTREGHFMARQELFTWWWSRIIEIAWQVMIPLASVGVLVFGGWLILEKRLTIGDLVWFSTLLLYMLGPLESLIASATNVQNNLAALDRVQDLLEEAQEFHDQKTRRQIDRAHVRGRLTLEHVTFAYPKRSDRPQRPGDIEELATPVLSDISLDVSPGETVAFVGRSGAGKTTLCNLIARFHDPTAGRILLDGQDLRELDVESYRRLLGIVEQEVFLFDGSVAENIGYAKRNVSMDEIIAAAHAANAHGFITDLEYGYDTLIGERGVRLSGGQKQRLAIARALLADPKILILDEATSNLDTESERLIQRSLSKLMEGRTSFVIAHRLSTIRHTDRIVVVENGEIIEQGTHTELIAKGGRYATVLEMQLEGDADAGGSTRQPVSEPA